MRLIGMAELIKIAAVCYMNIKKQSVQTAFYGGHEGSRTLDLCNANAALSQLSYAPECLIAEIILHLFA